MKKLNILTLLAAIIGICLSNNIYSREGVKGKITDTTSKPEQVIIIKQTENTAHQPVDLEEESFDKIASNVIDFWHNCIKYNNAINNKEYSRIQETNQLNSIVSELNKTINELEKNINVLNQAWNTKNQAKKIPYLSKDNLDIVTSKFKKIIANSSTDNIVKLPVIHALLREVLDPLDRYYKPTTETEKFLTFFNKKAPELINYSNSPQNIQYTPLQQTVTLSNNSSAAVSNPKQETGWIQYAKDTRSGIWNAAKGGINRAKLVYNASNSAERWKMFWPSEATVESWNIERVDLMKKRTEMGTLVTDDQKQLDKLEALVTTWWKPIFGTSALALFKYAYPDVADSILSAAGGIASAGVNVAKEIGIKGGLTGATGAYGAKRLFYDDKNNANSQPPVENLYSTQSSIPVQQYPQPYTNTWVQPSSGGLYPAVGQQQRQRQPAVYSQLPIDQQPSAPLINN